MCWSRPHFRGYVAAVRDEGYNPFGNSGGKRKKVTKTQYYHRIGHTKAKRAGGFRQVTQPKLQGAVLYDTRVR